MKIFKFIVFLLVFLISFSGCEKIITGKPAEVTPVFEFNSDAQVKLNKNEVKCNIFRTVNGIVIITVIEPKEIQGMKFSWFGDHQEVELLGLACKTQCDILPIESFANLIVNILNDASRLPKYHSVTLGSCNGVEYAVNISGETGKILMITVDSLNLEVKFI
jgi:hypothetical protein